MHSKELVLEKIKKHSIKTDDDAVNMLASIMDELCDNILNGAEKIAEYSNKESIDADAIKIAAYISNKTENLDLVKKL